MWGTTFVKSVASKTAVKNILQQVSGRDYTRESLEVPLAVKTAAGK
jgi:hypothetical protein